MSNKKISAKNSEFTMTKEGSLALLAYGDIGLREWRKFKNQSRNLKNDNEEE